MGNSIFGDNLDKVGAPNLNIEIKEIETIQLLHDKINDKNMEQRNYRFYMRRHRKQENISRILIKTKCSPCKISLIYKVILYKLILIFPLLL